MDISGMWYNQLGSQMILTVSGKKLGGTYHTKVGDASGIYELTGLKDIDNDASTAIGWVFNPKRAQNTIFMVLKCE